MCKILKKTAWRCNRLLCGVLIIVEIIPLTIFLIISSLVSIVFSPLFAFLNANNFKLEHATSESWWDHYKATLIWLCTDDLPIVKYYIYSQGNSN